MANAQNLVPNSARTPKQRRENARKAGKASGAKRKRLKTLAEELRWLLQLDIVDASGQKVNTQQAISTALIKAALHGDVKAFNAIRDTLGQKPSEKVETNVSLVGSWETQCKKTQKK